MGSCKYTHASLLSWPQKGQEGDFEVRRRITSIKVIVGTVLTESEKKRLQILGLCMSSKKAVYKFLVFEWYYANKNGGKPSEDRRSPQHCEIMITWELQEDICSKRHHTVKRVVWKVGFPDSYFHTILSTKLRMQSFQPTWVPMQPLRDNLQQLNHSGR
jgi:hypothetical protein